MGDATADRLDEKTPAMPNDRVRRGVSLLLDEYVGIQRQDQLVILYGRDAREPTAWIAAELGSRGFTPALIDMNVISGSDVRGFTNRMAGLSLTPGRIAQRLVVLAVECDAVTPSAWIRKALAEFPRSKVDMFRIVMAGKDFFEQGVNASPAVLDRINAGLLNKLRSVPEFKIRTSSGSDLDVTLDPSRYRWISNRGISREGAFSFLPAGEVGTYPVEINGVLVADGAFNVTAYTKLDPRLADHPVTIEIENGTMVNYRCEDESVRTLIRRCVSFPNADRVGELGFGTNVGIGRFTPLNSHLNERYPGVHIGFGQHNQLPGVLFDCDVHLDFIASDCTIEIEGERPIKSGQFKDLTGAHPAIEAGVFDEDLDGDCCGLFSIPT